MAGADEEVGRAGTDVLPATDGVPAGDTGSDTVGAAPPATQIGFRLGLDGSSLVSSCSIRWASG
jgi:hypothetical protein